MGVACTLVLVFLSLLTVPIPEEASIGFDGGMSLSGHWNEDIGSRGDFEPGVQTPLQPKPEVLATLMVYMCGDNSLEMELHNDIKDMEWAAAYIIEEVGYYFYDNSNIVVMYDRWDGFTESGFYDDETDFTLSGNWTDTRLIYITPDYGTDAEIVSPTYFPMGGPNELNMGDPYSLYYLVQWSTYFFPAENYYLIISDHGRGHRGVCQDVAGPGEDWLSIPELGSAMHDIDEYIGIWFDGRIGLVAFEACSMAFAEVIYEIRDYTDYIVASENTMVGAGWSYFRHFQSAGNPEVHNGVAHYFYRWLGTYSSHFAKRIVQEYENEFQHWDDLTLSAIDTQVFDSALVPTLNTFASELLGTLADNRNVIAQYRDDSLHFADMVSELGLTVSYEIDLFDFAQRIYLDSSTLPQSVKDAALAVTEAIVDCVIEEWDTMLYADAHGVAIIFYDKPIFYESYYSSVYVDLLMSQEIEWRHFIHLYWASEVPDKVENLVIQSTGDVYLEWDDVPDAIMYEIYGTWDRFRDFPDMWQLHGTTTDTEYVCVACGGTSNFFLVRADLGYGIVSLPSEMAFNQWLHFVYHVGQSNVYWISLPFDCKYPVASEIADELTESKINVVGKWNRQEQKSDVYFYARGRWRGTDFAIEPGDGIYLGVVSDFSWKHFGTEFPTDLQFPSSPYSQWFSLPYTHDYETASSLANDLTVSRIREIGKWDPATQQVGWTYYWDDMSQVWTGDDFDISGPGDGVYIAANYLPHISYLDYTSLDLKYAKWTGSWSTETVDSAGDVGGYASIALDDNGNPHMSYFDDTNKELKYAKWTGSWNIETVDSAGVVGTWTSIALDGNGNPHISYFDLSNGDLKYAKWTGSWNIETVDSAGVVGRHTSIALDGNGYPHISYFDISNLDLKYAKWTGSWNIETVDSAGMVGRYNSIALDGNGNPHISYFDGSNSDLKYAKWTGSWNIEMVDSTGGYYTSIALDGNGYPHISYYDYVDTNLKHAKWTAETGWLVETVDSADYVGFRSSIALDGNGNPHISYYNSFKGDLKYAMWTDNGWLVETVDSDVDFGSMTSTSIAMEGCMFSWIPSLVPSALP